LRSLSAAASGSLTRRKGNKPKYDDGIYRHCLQGQQGKIPSELRIEEMLIKAPNPGLRDLSLEQIVLTTLRALLRQVFPRAIKIIYFTLLSLFSLKDVHLGKDILDENILTYGTQNHRFATSPQQSNHVTNPNLWLFLLRNTDTVSLAKPEVCHAILRDGRVPAIKLIKCDAVVLGHGRAAVAVPDNIPLVTTSRLAGMRRRGRRRFCCRRLRRRRGRGAPDTRSADAVCLPQPEVGNTVLGNSRVPGVELVNRDTAVFG
jgi:hypothetical protein